MTEEIVRCPYCVLDDHFRPMLQKQANQKRRERRRGNCARQPSVRWRADSVGISPVHLRAMAKSRHPTSAPEETLDNLLDRVSNAREELLTIERTLERLRSDIAKMQKNRGGSGKSRP
jgi:hypothetical protein